MFSDLNTEVIGFESKPESERLLNDSSCQTSNLKTADQETQIRSLQSTACQAVPDASNITKEHPYDDDKLLKFLNRILPYLEEELKICDSNDLTLSSNNNEREKMIGEGEGEGGIEQSCKQTTLKPGFCKEKVVSCLSWNAFDIVLAVGCSELIHKGWCCHEAFVGLYNTEKPHFEKNPSQILKVSSCVRCVTFHSYIPSLLAAGLYNGDVVVWDLKHDEEVLVNKKKGSGDGAPHVDVITFLSWREDDNGLWLVSAGRDGRIIFWQVSQTNLTYEVYQRFLILKQYLITTAAPNEYLEVLHMDFRPSRSSYFVAACGGGIIFYCSTTVTGSITSFPQYKDPILRSYKPKKGIVTCVSCNADVFASCGTDSEIHIFKFDQETPVLKIYTNYPALGVRWSSPKELIIWGDSAVEYHKMQESRGKGTIYEVEGGISAVAFKTSSASNSKKFAIGNQRSDIIIIKNWTSA